MTNAQVLHLAFDSDPTTPDPPPWHLTLTPSILYTEDEILTRMKGNQQIENIYWCRQLLL